ncbi:hypothetical protein bering_145 [Salmonella phage bering]|uniref:Uncharacterized protein n=1 Tax=Salmonella phage bering TaxID=2713281 RepID=A0A6G9LAD5_9CAUD|nr:hypothetical protein HYQ32_gp145 [Salmonella phage bering]QIQ62011.1 hypothetical protein bering_145 [Salmonella phage bering]WDS51460.1 hypothetical protein SeF6a_144 [Salmonella phage SeF6a]
MKIFFPGQKVPEEIEKVELFGYKSGDPFLRFSSPCIVKRNHEGHYVRPIILMGSVMTLRAKTDSVVITGSPNIPNGKTTLNCKPILSSWALIGFLSIILFYRYLTNLGIL